MEFDWEDAHKVDPCNKTWCIVETEKGDYRLAAQHCGEWYNVIFPNWAEKVDIKRWAEVDREWLEEIINKELKK